MNVIINGAALPGDGEGQTDVKLETGEISQEMFTLQELAELTGTEDCQHRVTVWHLNSDQQHRYDATGIALIQYHEDDDTDDLFFFKTVVTGPFLYCLAVGDKLKAFHCETCAGDFAEFLLISQQRWKKKHHGSHRQGTKAGQVTH